MSKIIGIDLGTTNSCVSVMEGGTPVVIPTAEGTRTLPSVVAVKDGVFSVGASAKRQVVTNPNTVTSVKSKMGTTDLIRLEEKDYTPQEISAIILQKLKKQAEEYLGEEVTNAVITVPAYFNDAQRQATRDAGRIAGLTVDRIINEPTAAALAYGLKSEVGEQTILVFDLGGGTFDVSILNINAGVFEVVATAGDNKLGGDNFDEVLTDFLVQKFKEESGVDVSGNTMVMSRIRDEAEKLKRELSSDITSTLSLPFLTANESGPLHFEYTMSRAEFNEITYNLVQRTTIPVKQALADSGMSVADIDKIILVGGSTRIPAVETLVKNITGKEPYKGVNPDEAVSLGASIQGGILSGEVSGLVLIDVTPLSLGIETAGGIFTPIIERNSFIPTVQSKVFSTAADNQQAVTVKVFQGERALAKDNNPLGNFQLTGIAPAPRGVPQIEVSFSIDLNGIVSVSAKNLLTGQEQSITVQSSSNLKEEDINRMLREAEINAEKDEKVKEETKLKSDSEIKIQLAQKMLESVPQKFIGLETEKIKSLSDSLNQALIDNNFAAMSITTKELSDALSALSVKIYNDSNKDTVSPENSDTEL